MEHKTFFEQQIEKMVEVEVVRVKHPCDIRREGIHLVNPTIGAVLEAVVNAMRYGVNLVLIHTRPIQLPPPKDYNEDT
jgi:hypothetical protein